MAGKITWANGFGAEITQDVVEAKSPNPSPSYSSSKDTTKPYKESYGSSYGDSYNSRSYEPSGMKEVLGLPNLGMSCFANSVLNALYFVPQFTSYFSSLSRPAAGLASKLKTFVTQYGKQGISTSLLNQIREHSSKFPYGAQKGAYDFLLSILQTIDDTASSTVGADPGDGDSWEAKLRWYQSSGCRPLNEIFSVLLEEVRTCKKCKMSNPKYTYWRTLSLDLTPGERRSWSSSGASALSIESCLNSLLAPQEDARDAMHRCKSCGKDQIHITEKSIKHIGTALAIYLQRFHSDNPSVQVSIPEVIDMSRYLPGAGSYSLCSAVHHSGSTMGGHYTCYAKTRNGWMHLNDSSVSAAGSLKYCLSSSILFIYSKDD
jgi:uncharacterized UBP type Zn finger protein